MPQNFCIVRMWNASLDLLLSCVLSVFKFRYHLYIYIMQWWLLDSSIFKLILRALWFSLYSEMSIAKVIQWINFFHSSFSLLSNALLLTKAYNFDVFAHFFTQSENFLKSPSNNFTIVRLFYAYFRLNIQLPLVFIDIHFIKSDKFPFGNCPHAAISIKSKRVRPVGNALVNSKSWRIIDSKLPFLTHWVWLVF